MFSALFVLFGLVYSVLFRKDGSLQVVMVNTDTQYEEFVHYENFMAKAASICDETYLKAKSSTSIDDIAVLLTSSGSLSSKKKISCQSHSSVVNFAMFGQEKLAPMQEKDVVSMVSPLLDDCMYVATLVRIVMHGLTGVMGPPNMTFGSSNALMELVQKHRITWHTGLPQDLLAMINSPDRDKYNLSSLRGGEILGQVVSLESKRLLLKHFPDSCTLFGATEALSGLGTSKIWSTPEQRLLSLGYGYPHCKIKLVDSGGAIVPINHPGEICVRGWTVFKEYYQDAELTSLVLAPKHNGWYHYGDIGIMDETGHVTYLGRKAECVRFKHFGDVVYPSLLLEAVDKDSRINTAKVIGIPNDEKGDDICLCVEVKENETVTEDELKALMSTELMENMRPDYYFIFEKFPRAGSRQKIALVQIRRFVEDQLKKLKKN